MKRIEGSQAMLASALKCSVVHGSVEGDRDHPRPEVPPPALGGTPLPRMQAAVDRSRDLQRADPVDRRHVGGLPERGGDDRLTVTLVRSQQDDERRTIAVGEQLRASIVEYPLDEVDRVSCGRFVEQPSKSVYVTGPWRDARAQGVGDLLRWWPRWRTDNLCHGASAAGHHDALARLDRIEVGGEVVAQLTDAYSSHVYTISDS